MKLDKAAAAFLGTFASVKVRPDLIRPVDTDQPTYHVVMPDGSILQTGMSKAVAIGVQTEQAGRAAVVAVLREIVSPDMIAKAADAASIRLLKTENTKLNLGRRPPLALLEGLLRVLEEDANNAEGG